MKALPPQVMALFKILAGAQPPAHFSEADWQALIEFADRTQLTLHLRGAPGVPDEFRRQVELRFSRNTRRRERIKGEFSELKRTLETNKIEFIVLKGATHEAGFGISGEARVQYDIDLLCPRADEVRQALCAAGYAPHGEESLSDEHSRPLVKPNDWVWRNDYFDPDMPIAVEIHESLWNPKRDRISVRGLDDFRERCCTLMDVEPSVPAFAEPDRLGFAAIHALRHILRNDSRPASVYELARFLETRRSDGEFWSSWRRLHPQALRTLERIAFRFAAEWFGVALPEAAAEPLPDNIERWFHRFAWSPIANLISPNKDVLWLHAELTERFSDRMAVLRERLLPLRMPHHQEAAPYRQRLLDRARYHATGSASALASGVRWW